MLGLSVDAALDSTARIASIGIAIASVEDLISVRALRPHWRHRLALRGVGLVPARLLPLVVAIVFRLCAALWIVGWLGSHASSDIILLLVLWAATVYVILRMPLVQGADSQLTVITISGLILAKMPSQGSRNLAVLFLAVQVCCAYFAAGVHKMRSTEWRSGVALETVLRTRLFGWPPLARWLAGNRKLAQVMCWAVVLLEVSFPVVLIAPLSVGLFYCAVGVVFHAATAVAMGLNRFFWAFVAVYPIIVIDRWPMVW